MASKKTQVEVDSRIELVSVVQLYAPWVSEKERIVRHVYTDEALRTFERERARKESRYSNFREFYPKIFKVLANIESLQ